LRKDASRMAVIEHIALEPGMEYVLRRGFGNRKELRPRIRELLQVTLEEVREKRLLQPRVAYREYGVIEVLQEGFRLAGGAVLRCEPFSSRFPRPRGLVTAVCTIGPALERQVSLNLRRGEQLKGFLLDAVGSAAVDMLAAETCRLVKEALGRGIGVSSPVSPGMDGFSLSGQADLLALAGAGRIGVRLTSGGMLNPRKSLSMLLGIGAGMPRWTPEEVCERCPLAAQCPYRLQAAEKAPQAEAVPKAIPK